jgi:aromatic ring-opening dioxygenase catalytic subunit (LigB family)
LSEHGQVLFLSHGGGPLPLLGDAGHRQMVEALHAIAARLRPPSAILVISSHWEAAVPTLTAGPRPPLIYDYVGFPPEPYEIQYPCAGEPQLAGRIQVVLQRGGMPAVLDASRGFDHGMFVPLKILFPEARIPCVQLSLLKSLSPAEHLALGRQLGGLAEENLLVIGSGFSFHNLPEFFRPGIGPDPGNMAFEAWLRDTCSNANLSEAEREQRLLHWDRAPPRPPLPPAGGAPAAAACVLRAGPAALQRVAGGSDPEQAGRHGAVAVGGAAGESRGADRRTDARRRFTFCYDRLNTPKSPWLTPPPASVSSPSRKPGTAAWPCSGS